MKDLKGREVEVPQFERSIKDSFREALAAVDLGKGDLVEGGYERCLFVLLDGFGYRTMQEAGVLDKLGMPAVEVGSTVPSVTATALMSIFSGLDPAEHGVIGTRFWLPELGGGFSALEFTDLEGMPVALEPSELSLQPGIMEGLEEDGVGVHVVLPEELETGLSSSLYPGSTGYFVPGLGGVHYGLEQFFASGDPLGIVYSIFPDKFYHYGMGAASVHAQLRAMSSVLRDFADSPEAEDTCLIIAGDHGSRPTTGMTDLLDVRHLLRAPPMGGSRHRHLFTRRGKKEAVAEMLEGVYVLDGQEALDKGFFGDAHPSTHDRMGDLFLLPAGDNALVYDGLPYESDHGGLSPEEMSAALAHCRLSEFAPDF